MFSPNPSALELIRDAKREALNAKARAAYAANPAPFNARSARNYRRRAAEIIERSQALQLHKYHHNPEFRAARVQHQREIRAKRKAAKVGVKMDPPAPAIGAGAGQLVAGVRA